MKLIYSHLKKLLPDLSVDPKNLRDGLTLIGHFVSGFESVDNDIVFEIEVRQNRGDCLGYYGVAKDLSVLYQIPLVVPSPILPSPVQPQPLPIKVTAINEVKRIQALRLSNLSNSSSPVWLQKILQLHQVNSINTIVDLTNYIMFLYGLPNHAFDVAKSTPNLIWELNHQFKDFVTLDGTQLSLIPGILMVNNSHSALSLSFLGGQSCAIGDQTTDIIIEMAVYDRVRVRTDYRFLKTTTEAAIRLDKSLDPELIPLALSHLAALILENCGGQITSQLFDYYPQKASPLPINFDLQKPSLYAGIDIPQDYCLDVFRRLDCQLQQSSNSLTVTPPTLRPDISIEEDLIEEAIRFFGYHQIPLDQPISSKPLPDITPPILPTIENLKNHLTSLGYDEIRSWPLVKDNPYNPRGINSEIRVQNSINEDYQVLRPSIIQSLQDQIDSYTRFKLPNPQFFEIGKVFYLDSSQTNPYQEKYSLGIYHPDPLQLISDLARLNLTSVAKISDHNFCEIILDGLDQLHLQPLNSQNVTNSAYELTSQIITLDANINLDSQTDPQAIINTYSAKIDSQYLWQILITDIFFDPKIKKYRYTFRVSYFNCDDKVAKKIHLKTFNLEKYLRCR